MNNSIFTILILLAVAYIYTLFITRKNRKKKNNNKKDPSEYQAPYQYQWYYYSRRETSDHNTTRYNNYVTKYNSQEDYREATPQKPDPKDPRYY